MTTARVVLPLLTVTTGGVNVEVEVATARINFNFWLSQDARKVELTSRSNGGGDIGRDGGGGNVERLAERSVNISRSSGNKDKAYSVGLGQSGSGNIGSTSLQLVGSLSSSLALGNSGFTLKRYRAIEQTTADLDGSRSRRSSGSSR